MQELHSHPHDRRGFVRADFDPLTPDQRRALAAPVLDEVVTGSRYAATAAQWLFNDGYPAALAERLETLPANSPGRLYLPLRLFEATGERGYLETMARELACPAHDANERGTALFCLSRVPGSEALFRDLCRHLVLHDPVSRMRQRALLDLARDVGYPEPWYPPNEELRQCLEGVDGAREPSRPALAILDRLHIDTGACAFLPRAGHPRQQTT